MDAPFFPIIYVRGYAMTVGERDETAADPFCGFNLGSTAYRATPDKNAPPKKFIFESPVLRLGSDHGYRDIYENGLDILDPDWAPPVAHDGTQEPGIGARSIVVYRYYDEGSRLHGSGKAESVEHYARGLSELIGRVRDLVCARPANEVKPKDFRCYLVAHSMGGLVVRAFLQNPELGDKDLRKSVDKVFTYGTPHNGIDTLGFNVPKWLTINDIDNFNRERIAEYLGVKDHPAHTKGGRVDLLPPATFPASRFFCMVGTNRSDYEVALGLSRTFAGHGSDGLVRIENATVWGANAKGDAVEPAACAYAYRAHSGVYGIVNSEEGYQNLTRFLFGDVRVDVWLDIDEVTLPTPLQGKKDIQALYQIEFLASPRGKRWYLTRRVAEEDSPACRTHQELTDPAAKDRRSVYLSTVFLANNARVNRERPSLAYAMTLNVRTPDYQQVKSFWPDQHYEGNHLFRDTAVIELVPPKVAGETWQFTATWQGQPEATARAELSFKQLKQGKVQVLVPFENAKAPGIKGKVRLIVSGWNEN